MINEQFAVIENYVSIFNTDSNLKFLKKKDKKEKKGLFEQKFENFTHWLCRPLIFLILKEKRMKGENDISPIELIKFFRGLLLADLHVPSLSFY